MHVELTIQTPELEKTLYALHTGNPQSKEWFTNALRSILEDRHQPFFHKADTIAETLVSVDQKIDYLQEQIKKITALKKQLELSLSTAKEEVAKVLLSYGLDRLDGVTVSSITVTPAKEELKNNIVIHDELSLIQAGYFTATLDKESVANALHSADESGEVEDFAMLDTTIVHKPASIRINKKRALTDSDDLRMAS